jgi:hypothetical protein
MQSTEPPSTYIIAAIITATASILAALITYLTTRHIYKSNQKEQVDLEVEKSIKVFDPPQEELYNKDFYRYFEEKIKGAKDSIYITGEGFGYSNEDGIKIAESFNDAIKFALRNKVVVIRVQINVNHNPRWVDSLSNLLEEFHPRFRLFLLDGEKDTEIPSVCVIDPHNKKDSVSEIMLSTTKLVQGINKSRIADTGIFIKGKDQLAMSLQQSVNSLVEHSTELKNKEDVQKYLVENNRIADKDLDN